MLRAPRYFFQPAGVLIKEKMVKAVRNAEGDCAEAGTRRATRKGEGHGIAQPGV